MALTTYSELKDSVLAWLNRPDFANVVEDFITLAEKQIARQVRRATVRHTVIINSGSYTLPADCAELRSIHLVTSRTGADLPLQICTTDMLAEARARHSSTGRPKYGAIVGTQLLLIPAPDDVYTAEIVYFQKLAPLSATNASNAILVEAPDAYLFGALKEAAPYMEHDERVALWEQKYNTAIAQLTDVREREEFNASLRPVRLPRVIG